MASAIEDVSPISDFLNNLQSKAYLCDVAFVVGEEKAEVYGIKAILSIRSSIFANLFQLQAIQTYNSRKLRRATSQQKQIIHIIGMPNYTREEFSALMEYIHCGVCDIGPKIVIGLFVAADEFNLINLKRACVSFLGQHLNLDNAVYVFSELERFQARDCANELEPLVFNFIRSNADKILSEATIVVLSKSQLIRIFCLEGLQLPEAKKFYAALIWTKAQVRKSKSATASLQATFSPFLNFIKLTKIPIQVLVEDVRRSRVIPERLLAHACAHNELKESFSSTQGQKNYSARKREDLSTFNQPFVVGIHSSSSGQSLSNGRQISDKRSSKKLGKTSKNRYDVSYQQSIGYLNASSSKPRLTKKPSRTFSFTSADTQKPSYASSKSEAPSLASFRPKLLRSSRLLISNSQEMPERTPSRPKLTKSSKISSSAPFLDILF
ncbi:serine-enriched protein-like isoform X2 [Rhopilema esculentum]|eukprot:gene14630-5715_t